MLKNNTETLRLASERYLFADALKEEQAATLDYDREKWLYLPCYDTDHRYILGTQGKHPLICIGVNPSTARPDSIDKTMMRVQNIAKANGFDSVRMCNIYARRGVKADHLEIEPDVQLHTENLKAIEWVLQQVGARPPVWAAWGTSVDCRSYLTDYMKDIVSLCQKYNVQWLTAGSRSKAKGHPHHPLYLPHNSILYPFEDIDTYINKL